MRAEGRLIRIGGKALEPLIEATGHQYPEQLLKELSGEKRPDHLTRLIRQTARKRL